MWSQVNQDISIYFKFKVLLCFKIGLFTISTYLSIIFVSAAHAHNLQFQALHMYFNIN